MKKRGLIVSTIVMVVVLAIAVSTATFAWFSSTQPVEVRHVRIQTIATEGLEIAVFDANSASGFVNGTLDWDGNFTGTDGFGRFVDFINITGDGSDLGQLDTAVEPFVGQELYRSVGRFDDADQFGQFVGDLFFIDYALTVEDQPNANFEKMVPATAWVAGTIYYTDDDAGTPPAFVRPIAYKDALDPGSSNLIPIAFQRAVTNSDYMVLPIAVQATSSNIQYILCEIEISPEQLAMGSDNFMPGMAASLVIEIVDEDNNKTVVKPFDDYELGVASMFYSSGQDTVLWKNDTTVNQTFVYRFVVAMDEIAARNPYKLTYTFWLDGEDDENRQAVAGSGFDILIKYTFSVNADHIVVRDGTEEQAGFGNAIALNIGGTFYNIISATIGTPDPTTAE